MTQTNDRIAFAAPGTTAPGLTRPAGAPQLHALRLVKALDMPSWWKTAQAVAEEGTGGLLPPRLGATYQDGVPMETPEELIDPQSDDPFAGAYFCRVLMGCVCVCVFLRGIDGVCACSRSCIVDIADSVTRLLLRWEDSCALCSHHNQGSHS